MSSKVLSVKNLTKRFPGVVALQNLSFNLRKGEVHALCGENGAGKSTLIKCISGIWPYGSYEGEIIVSGEKAAFNGIEDSENHGIAVIYQELALVGEMTVAENIFLGKEPKRGMFVDWHRMYTESRKILKEYELDLNPNALVKDLGIGQQQLVEIVKALAKDSKILLLDEPTAALTDSEVEKLLKIIEQLRSRGISCLYISHRLDEVMRISDRITVLRDGQSIITQETSEMTEADVIRNMVGREIKNLFPERKSTPGEVLFSVKDLQVELMVDGLPKLEDINFDLKKGEVLGIGGLMGAGRSELIMHLFCSRGKRVSGEVSFKGGQLLGNSTGQSIEKGMIMVTEDRKRLGLILDESIAFNMSLSHLKTFVRNGLVDRHSEMIENKKYFESLRVKAPGLQYSVGGLSGGNQQKVVLGKALMTSPDLIFLDEPTRGIDIGAKAEIYELINDLVAQGKAVILVSSELPELMGMSDRILILSSGRQAEIIEKESATEESLLRAAMKYS